MIGMASGEWWVKKSKIVGLKIVVVAVFGVRCLRGVGCGLWAVAGLELGIGNWECVKRQGSKQTRKRSAKFECGHTYLHKG